MSGHPTLPDGFHEHLIRLALRRPSFQEILNPVADMLLDQGVPIARIRLAARTLHPSINAVGARWNRDARAEDDGIFTHQEMTSRSWLDSPLRFMMKNHLFRMRRRLTDPGVADEFPVFREFLDEGITDYLAHMEGYGADRTAESDGMLVRWMSDAPAGFSDADIALLDRLSPLMAIAIAPSIHHQVARNLLETYVGQRTGALVLSGAIEPGYDVGIDAVILVADLRGFTSATGEVPGDRLNTLLDRHFDAMLPPIVDRGGEILAFLGDGVLAAFEIEDGVEDRARSAVAAAIDAVEAVRALRLEDGLPTLPLDVAVHAGTVRYGNVGAAGRQTFTVVGPAVNETSRIEGLCAALGYHVLVSEKVAAAAGDDKLVPVGAHRLRGVDKPLGLYGALPRSAD